MSKKRAYNKKGNPFKRGNTWTFIYYVNDEKGNKIQRWKGGYKTKGEADLKKYEAKIALNQFVPHSKMLLKSFLSQWFDLHKKNLEPSTINGYRVNIDNHIISKIGNVRLSDLKTSDVEKMYIELRDEKGLSGKTIKYVHNVLKTALKSAVNDNLIEKNVCLQAKQPKVKKYQSKVLS